MPDALADRVALGDKVVYMTNSSIWHHTDFLARLPKMGAPISSDCVVSAARATALYLAQLKPRPQLTLIVGAPGLVREISETGIGVLSAADTVEAWPGNGHDAAAATAGVDAVGLDTSFTYARMVVAADAVRNGAIFVAVDRARFIRRKPACRSERAPWWHRSLSAARSSR